MPICEKYGLTRVINAIGMPTITGAHVVAEEVIREAAEILRINVEIDELQRAASRVIARATGAEAGCVTSSSSSGIAVAAAAAMTGADLGRIMALPDTAGLRDEIVMQDAHDVNFGARISQMVRITGARPVKIGTANHCDEFHLRAAISERTAALLFAVTGAIHPKADLLPLEQCAAVAVKAGVPVIVDAAAEDDVRPFLAAGADLVIVSGHKSMGALTSGLLCGRKDLIRACYLQNWGIGRAMKVGKEGIAGLMAAVERWYSRDLDAERTRWRKLASIFGERLTVHPGTQAHRIGVDTCGANPRDVANLLREGDPPVWVKDCSEGRIVLDLRVMDEGDARTAAGRIAEVLRAPRTPVEDVPYHDLYRSERRLLSWPD